MEFNFICIYDLLKDEGGGENRNDVPKIPTILLCPYLAASYLFITT
jgi:hypothetical protein